MIEKVVRYSASDGTLASTLEELRTKETAHLRVKILKILHMDGVNNEHARAAVAQAADKIIKDRHQVMEVFTKFQALLDEIKNEELAIAKLTLPEKSEDETASAATDTPLAPELALQVHKPN